MTLPNRRSLDSRCEPAQQPNSIDSVRLLGWFVGAIAKHPGEAQRYPARVAGAALYSVEGDLYDEVWLDPHQPVILLYCSGEELLGLPGQQLVGHAFECLAEHDELATAGIASAKMEVGQPAPAATMTPLGGENDEVEGVPRLHFDPAGAAAAGGVGRVERLDHDALVPSSDSVGEELGRPGRIGGDESRNPSDTSRLRPRSG